MATSRKNKQKTTLGVVVPKKLNKWHILALMAIVVIVGVGVRLVSEASPSSYAKNVYRAYGCKSHPVLKKGSKGACVKAVQKLLQVSVGSSRVPSIDGVYGNQTAFYVEKFQRKVFPGQTQEFDGVVGGRTWAKLDKVTASGGGANTLAPRTSTPKPTPKPTVKPTPWVFTNPFAKPTPTPKPTTVCHPGFPC